MLIAIKHNSLPSFVLNQRLQNGNLQLNTKGSTTATTPTVGVSSVSGSVSSSAATVNTANAGG